MKPPAKAPKGKAAKENYCKNAKTEDSNQFSPPRSSFNITRYLTHRGNLEEEPEIVISERPLSPEGEPPVTRSRKELTDLAASVGLTKPQKRTAKELSTSGSDSDTPHRPCKRLFEPLERVYAEMAQGKADGISDVVKSQPDKGNAHYIIPKVRSVGIRAPTETKNRRLSLKLDPKESKEAKKVSTDGATEFKYIKEVEVDKLDRFLEGRALVEKRRLLFEKRERIKREISNDRAMHKEFSMHYEEIKNELSILERNSGNQTVEILEGDNIVFTPAEEESTKGKKPRVGIPTPKPHKATVKDKKEPRGNDKTKEDAPRFLEYPVKAPSLYELQEEGAANEPEEVEAMLKNSRQHSLALADLFYTKAKSREDIVNLARKFDKQSNDLLKDTVKVSGHNTTFKDGEEAWSTAVYNILLHLRPHMPEHVAKACEKHLMSVTWGRVEFGRKLADGKIEYPCPPKRQKKVPVLATFSTPLAPRWIMANGAKFLEQLQDLGHLPKSVAFDYKYGMDTERMQKFSEMTVHNLNRAFDETGRKKNYPEIKGFWKARVSGIKKYDVDLMLEVGTGWDKFETIFYNALCTDSRLARFTPTYGDTGQARPQPVPMMGYLPEIQCQMAFGPDTFGIPEVKKQLGHMATVPDGTEHDPPLEYEFDMGEEGDVSDNELSEQMDSSGDEEEKWVPMYPDKPPSKVDTRSPRNPSKVMKTKRQPPPGRDNGYNGGNGNEAYNQRHWQKDGQPGAFRGNGSRQQYEAFVPDYPPPAQQSRGQSRGFNNDRANRRRGRYRPMVAGGGRGHGGQQRGGNNLSTGINAPFQ